MMVKISEDKDYLLKIIKASFNEIIYNTFHDTQNIKINDNLLNWVFLKLNILLKNQFRGDLTIEKNKKIEWLLTTRTYDLSIRSKSLNRTILVITLHKIWNNTNKTFYTTYKDIIFNTVNLWAKNIPYYSLVMAPLNTVNDRWQTEVFSTKNLLRVYNWNKSGNVQGLTKVVLFEWNIASNKFDILQDTWVIVDNRNISDALNNWVIMPDIKQLFSDIYNILQKYN